MPTYSTNVFRSGLKVLFDGYPCVMLESEFVKPGKGQAFTRVKLRNLKTDRVLERTFKSGETIEAADVVETGMQYLYSDNKEYHFMSTDGSYEQLSLNEQVMGETKNWLKEESEYIITLWNGEAILVQPPNFIDLEVIETDPGVRGNTESGGTKPATLSTGAVVKVPLFVEIGDKVRVDTRKGEYMNRS